MLDFMYMIRDVITDLFTRQVGKWQGEWSTKGEPTQFKALLIHFRIKKDRIQMLIHAPANYVGVYIRTKEGRFECISYHDSCWRSDGVEHFLYQHHEHIGFCPFPVKEGWNIIETITDAIHVVKLDEVQLDGLKQIRKKKYG